MDIPRWNVVDQHVRAEVHVARPDDGAVIDPDLTKYGRVRADGAEPWADEVLAYVSLYHRPVREREPQPIPRQSRHLRDPDQRHAPSPTQGGGGIWLSGWPA